MLRILLIDDSPADRRLAIRILQQEFTKLQIQEVIQPQDLEQALAQGQFDLVITDYQLRWNNGLAVLRTIKARYPHLPVIMFTNSGSQEIAVEGMKSGLDDYVVKSPHHFVRLPVAVRSALERLESRRKIAGLESRFQSLLNQLNVGVYRLTSEGVLLEANAAFLRLLGLEAATEFPKNETLERYFEPEAYTLLLDQLRQNGEVRDREILLQRADRTRIWVKVSKVFTRFDDITLIDGLIEDIHDRKRAEQQLLNTLSDNTRLYQEAQEASRMKDEFLAIVSHELRTPLNAMLGWASMLKDRQLDAATTAKALTTIERNARLQNKLINDILDISRIVQNRLQLDLHLVHLQPIIYAVIEDIQPTAQAKSIQLTSQLDTAVNQVMGDAERLQQIVWNLLSNAIKFTPSGGQVTVRLEQIVLEPSKTETVALRPQTSQTGPAVSHTPPSMYAQIVISDTGQGIHPDFLPYVFDRFRQADSSKTRSHGGLGLGLAIVRHLVEMHNGRVFATSQGVGQGASFTVQLPINLPQSSRSPRRDLSYDNAPSLRGLRVLIVDDDVDTRQLLTFVLEAQEAEVFTAGSAAEARHVLSKVTPDLLLCDIGMPDENGYALIRSIRVTQSADQLPAIALTAFVREEDVQEAFAAGFQKHLAKPFDPTEVVTVIVNLCDPQVNFNEISKTKNEQK